MKLPPMNALRMFEAVSRLGSVSRAAEELCVSQGAVSQQLRNLEDNLGRDLFIRSPNSFTLSEEGAEFAEVVQQSLGEIASAAGRVKREETLHTLTISLPPGIADKWLMPRLGDFYGIFPDVTIALKKTVKNVTFKNDGIDAAIRFGDGSFENLHSIFLFPFKKFAMASPAYVREHGYLEDLANPGQHRLIDCRRESKELDFLCGRWADVVDNDFDDLEQQPIVLPDDHQALNAAIHGQGISLTPIYLMEAEIEAGDIVYANRDAITFPGAFYFISPKGVRANAQLDAFRDWLVDVLADFRSEENRS